MSFSALTGVYLKLTRLFLKICRWFLVKMSLNCKFSGSNGRLSNNFKLKKEREAMRVSNSGWKWSRPLIFSLLLVLLMGCFWFFSAVNDEALKKMDNHDLCEYQAQILLEHLNVSKEELSSLASLFSVSDQTTNSKCSKQSGYAIPPRYVVGCALKVLSSVDQKIKWRGWAAELIEAKGQCPVQDQNILRKFGPSMPGDGSLQFISQFMPCSLLPCYQASEEHVWRRTALDNLTREHCRGISFCLIKACWLVLVGIALSCSMPRLHEKLSNRKQKLVQQQTMSEQHLQQQLLLQRKQQQQTHSSSRSIGKWRKKLLFMFVLAGVVGSIWLFWHLNEDIMFRRKETLVNMCDERARMLQDQFNVSMNHVHALAILISTFHHGKQPSAIDQETFKQHTEHTAFERPLTSGVAYALRVLHSEREQFEKQHGEIKKMENEDQSLVQDCRPENLDPSPIQDEYAPVIFSQETVAHINSIDMMSGKEDRENILRARASGKGVLTSPFKLLKSNHLGVVLTFAVYSTHLPRNATSEQRINATVGYLGASYDVPSLVEKLLHQLASKQTIVVNVYDTTNRSAPIMMFGNDTTDTGLLHISSLDFGDPARKHEIHCRFKQKPPPPWTAIIASVGVLVITFLLGHIFHAAINQISKVEDDYRAMMELKHRAEAADVAKSQFLATVSHEIRTPMNGVLGMLQMLMDTNLDATQMDYAETAHASGKELISLINEVLDQAKIESGKLELETVPFDLRDVLDNVVSLFSGKSDEKGFELAVYVSSQVPEVVIGDPVRFRQIITNLVGNSVKFTDNKKKGHIFVSVHLADEVGFPHCMRDEVLRQSLTFLNDSPNTFYSSLSGLPVVDRSKSWENFKNLNCHDSKEETGMIKLLLTVEDTGVGIPLEAQSRIFMPFMQADSSTSRTYGGTGIGLSISKRLVDLMGGEIGFVSEHGTGSTFSFTAAFTKGETSSLDANWQHYDQTVSKFGGLQALVVDSKSIRAEVARYHLQRLGISVDVFSSVDSACSCMSGHSKGTSGPLSMVLIDKDIWDSETGGAFHSLIKEFRPNGCTEVLEIPPKIFLLATCISSNEQNELKSTGLVDNVITKPLRRSVLISCFQEATGIGRKRRITRGRPSDLGNLLKDKHILVVDDNLVNRRVAEGHLKKYGAIITCVDSGKAALEMLKPPHKFDACLMDLQMPEMDGFEATRQIRRLESKFNGKIDSGEAINGMFKSVARWHTPILAMTADVIQATNEKCTTCGMDDYVSKPFEEGQLYSVVARFFESG